MGFIRDGVAYSEMENDMINAPAEAEARVRTRRIP
jgi:hypothetical protein